MSVLYFSTPVPLLVECVRMVHCVTPLPLPPLFPPPSSLSQLPWLQVHPTGGKGPLDCDAPWCHHPRLGWMYVHPATCKRGCCAALCLRYARVALVRTPCMANHLERAASVCVVRHAPSDGMLGFGHNDDRISPSVSREHCMANVMTPALSQLEFFEGMCRIHVPPLALTAPITCAWRTMLVHALFPTLLALLLVSLPVRPSVPLPPLPLLHHPSVQGSDWCPSNGPHLPLLPHHVRATAGAGAGQCLSFCTVCLLSLCIQVAFC